MLFCQRNLNSSEPFERWPFLFFTVMTMVMIRNGTGFFPKFGHAIICVFLHLFD